jgi:FkbM family methyltransferase
VTVVVDLGCVDRPDFNAYSLMTLADEYKPELIYGFDPSPQLDVSVRSIVGIPVKLSRKAAWLYDGTIAFEDEWVQGRPGMIGVGSKLSDNGFSLGRVGIIGTGEKKVKCFDFSRWLDKHGPAVVKMDIEGSEYALLNRLLDDGTDAQMTELVIEWHDYPDDEILERLSCPVRDWWM